MEGEGGERARAGYARILADGVTKAGDVVKIAEALENPTSPSPQSIT